jgi:hypothetical protein
MLFFDAVAYAWLGLEVKHTQHPPTNNATNTNSHLLLLSICQVREKVPLKSKLGGLSTLQAAVCYDTLGNARTAEALYKRCAVCLCS